jgi:signal transduction histidine kinase
MKEEEMRGVVSVQREETAKVAAPPSGPVMSLPAEALARLQRLATGNLLATGLAHELAGPLSSLMAALGALGSRVGETRADGVPLDVQELGSDLELASVAGNEMFALVRDFQTYLRPGAAEITGPTELKPAILRALRMARSRLAATTPVSVALSEAPTVRIPPNRLTQIVLNLLLNAADALADRPWSANLVEVRLETVEHWAVIEVEDNGPGPSAWARARLFEPGASTKSGGSLGLGLAICRELARSAGGEITVSPPGAAGTLFRVVLPPATSGTA